LTEAIGAYRVALDGVAEGPLATDLRHNLELAKRLLANRRKERDQESIQPKENENPNEAPSAKPSKKDGSRTGTDPKVAPKDDPSAKEGGVGDPLAGLAASDPGPLSVDEAKRRLAAALARQKAALPKAPPARRSQSDY
jgi:hypothetical protein